jgi:hypothetical protein
MGGMGAGALGLGEYWGGGQKGYGLINRVADTWGQRSNPSEWLLNRKDVPENKQTKFLRQLFTKGQSLGTKPPYNQQAFNQFLLNAIRDPSKIHYSQINRAAKNVGMEDKFHKLMYPTGKPAASPQSLKAQVRGLTSNFAEFTRQRNVPTVATRLGRAGSAAGIGLTLAGLGLPALLDNYWHKK